MTKSAYPYLITVSDYHEFPEEEQKLQNPQVKVIEIGLEPFESNSYYVGVVYLKGQKTTKKQIAQMVQVLYPDYSPNEILNEQYCL